MNNKRIIAGIMAFCLMGRVMPNIAGFMDNAIITASAEANDESWKDAYADFLKQYVKENPAAVFTPVYIDNDDIPELAIRTGNGLLHGVSIVTYYNGKTEIHGEFGSLGSLPYGERKNVFVSTPSRSPYSTFYGIENGNLVKLYEIDSTTASETEHYKENIDSYIGDESPWLSINEYNIRDHIYCKCGEKLTWNLDSEGTLTISGKGDMFDYEHQRVPWKKEDIKKVVINDGVTSIGILAFHDCVNLTDIVIPESVTHIGYSAFYNTPWSKQEGNAFVIVNNILIYSNNRSGDIVIPDGVKHITGKAFEYGDLTSVTIPDSVISIDSGVFLGCTNLKDVIIPETLTGIHGWAFVGTPWLENKRTENPLVIVNDSLIDGKTCSGDVIITDNVKVIADGAFYISSPDLTSVKIPNGITKIGDDTFSNCTGLTSINIPDSVTSIGNRAFFYCGSLTSIEIPATVKSIGTEAFCSCESLKEITILNPECDINDSIDTISNGYDENTNNQYYDGTIYGYDNSTAQAYAEKYDNKFESLGKAPEKSMGDVDGDGMIDASDASLILAEYALLSTGEAGTFTEDMKKSADINKDGQIDSVDSSLILSYYSYTSTGGTDTIEKFLETSDK